MRTSRLAPPHAPCLPPAASVLHAITMHCGVLYCEINVYKLSSRDRARTHEIGIQKAHTKHRKLDSQATLSHRARGRAADGLRSQRPTMIGLRPAMAADRAVRGSPACAPRQER